MTRGIFVLITDDGVYRSVEFNGDMYPQEPGYGEDIIWRLSQVTDVKDFENTVANFDSENFGYAEKGGDDDLVWEMAGPFNKKFTIDFSGNFYHYWGADYIYVKSLATKPREIFENKKEYSIINPGEIQIFDFGNHLETIRED